MAYLFTDIIFMSEFIVEIENLTNAGFHFFAYKSCSKTSQTSHNNKREINTPKPDKIISRKISKLDLDTRKKTSKKDKLWAKYHKSTNNEMKKT